MALKVGKKITQKKRSEIEFLNNMKNKNTFKYFFFTSNTQAKYTYCPSRPLVSFLAMQLEAAASQHLPFDGKKNKKQKTYKNL